MNQVVSIHAGENFKVIVKFSDGFSGELDVYPFIKGGISGKLKDPDFFKNVKVDEFGGISWENGFDFCPNFLFEYLQSNRQA